MEHLQAKQLAARIGFDADVAALVEGEAGSPLRLLHHEVYSGDEINPADFSCPVRVTPGQRLEGCNYEVTRIETDGLFFTAPESHSRQVVLRLRAELEPKGYLPFVLANHLAARERSRILRIPYGEALKNRDEEIIGIIKSRDQLDILRLQGTNGCNCNVSNSDVVRKFEEWKSLCEYSIIGAGEDWADVELHTLPRDLQAFAEDVYRFCPDTLHQGYVGPPLGDGKAAAEMSRDEVEALMEQLGEAIDNQTPHDLAEFFRREKRLWLWWD